ncbi:10452_t:CDS:2 [Paraglomus brasilianum]|uniref:10452_t:CDS:1 n=1 Tax=Paraglomus brasilianum TaxID=144538 RepID=A0A9N8ZJ89_9GLOM|nr:10452_t:CDS:2 [Paraglomus brasilianum]
MSSWKECDNLIANKCDETATLIMNNNDSMTVGGYEQIVTGDIPPSNSPKTKRIYRQKSKAAAAAAAVGLPRNAITCAPLNKEGYFWSPNTVFVLCGGVNNMDRGIQSETSPQTIVGNDAGSGISTGVEKSRKEATCGEQRRHEPSVRVETHLQDLKLGEQSSSSQASANTTNPTAQKHKTIVKYPTTTSEPSDRVVSAVNDTSKQWEYPIIGTPTSFGLSPYRKRKIRADNKNANDSNKDPSPIPVIDLTM